MLRTSKLALRFTALLAATTFVAVSAVDAAGLHGCPVHDVLPESATAPVAMHAGHAAGAPHGEAPDPPSHADHDGPCTCVGSCSTGTSAQGTGAVAAGIAPVEPPAVDAERMRPTAHAQLPDAPSYLLPYALGPPLSV